MSLDYLNAVYSQSKTTGASRFLLVTLAHHADKFGVCWPGVETLAAEQAVTPRTLQKTLHALRQSGEVIVIEGGGRNISNRYIITLGQSLEQVKDTLENHPDIPRLNHVNIDTLLDDKTLSILTENPVKNDRGTIKN